MHGSIWTFRGEPDQLLAAYDGLVAEILPAVTLHLCLRMPDGIAASDDFRTLRARHGLPDPERVSDFPVHVAIVDGRPSPHREEKE